MNSTLKIVRPLNLKWPLRTALLGSVAVGLLAMSPPPASAQEATEEGETSRRLDSVTVTGRLRDEAESLQSVPIAVTVVSPAQLAAQGSLTIEDVETLSPNLIIDNNGSGAGAAGISLRGVDFADVEKSQEPTVGVVIDGVFSATNTGLLTNTFDFEQVEVLRGPQGTLFGRNTIGGVINIRRTRPTGEFGLRAEATAGSFGRQEFNGVVNFGLTENVAVKLFGYDGSTDGFYENATLGRDAGATSNTNFGASVLLTPTDAFEVLLTAEHNDIGGETPSSSLSNDGDVLCLLPPDLFGPGAGGVAGTNQCNRTDDDDFYTIFQNDPGEIDYSGDSYKGQLDYDFGNLTLTSITAYNESEESVRQDFDASAQSFFETFREDDYYQFTQEVRLAGNFTDRLSGVFGVFYLDNEVNLSQVTNLGGALTGLPFSIPIPSATSQALTSYALFADFDFELTDRLRLGFGGRFTKDEKDFTRTITEFETPARVNQVTVVVDATDEWEQFTPRVSLDYDFSDDILLYASYSQGFRAGGFNSRAGSRESVEASFDPETIDSFELGAKTSLLNDRLTFNVAAFLAEYQDKQEGFISFNTSPLAVDTQETITANVASAKISGLEVDMRALLSDYFTVTGTLGLLDAEYDEFEFGGQDISALEIRRAPDVTFSIAGDFQYPVTNNGDLNANVRLGTISEYQTALSVPPPPGPRIETDRRGLASSQTNLSASIGYSHELENGKEIYIRAFGRNLTDNRGAAAGIPVAGLFTFGLARSPREYGVTIGGRF